MKNDTLKIGIISCGGLANSKHMPSLQKVKDVEMVAFCDIAEEKARKAKADFGTEDAQVYTDYKKLLEDPSIDVVHICSPNRSHSFMTVDALDAGKHVMCEKPMAINSAEAQKMIDARDRSGKLLSIGYQNRFRSDVQFLKAEAEAGTLGEIYYAEAIAVRRRAVPTWGVFLNEYEQGGGPLIDIGTHALDLALWMMNNYKPKYCVGTTFHKLNNDTATGNAWGDWNPEKFTAEDSAFGFVVMENGATVYLKSSWALNIADPREAITTLCGTKGGADMLDGLRINCIRNNKQCILKPDFNPGGVAFNDASSGLSPEALEAKLWIEAVRNNTAPVTTAEQAFTVTRILEGIYTSAKTGDIFRF